MVSLSFGLDSFEQFGVRSFKLICKFDPCIQSIGINLESFSEFFCGRILKERNVLIKVRHDEFVA